MTSRDELRPVQGGTEDTDERAMTSHTEMCEGCEVTFVEEGHDVERVPVRCDVVKETKSVGEAQQLETKCAMQTIRQGTGPRPTGETKHKVSIEYVQ